MALTKRILTIVSALVVAAAPVFAQGGRYGWSISSSSTDPLVNAGPVVSAPFALYLWLYCTQGVGMSAAEFDVALPAGMFNFGFTTMNGFQNAGTGSNLLLVVFGCPLEPVLAGSWLLFGPSSQGSICLVPSVNGNRVTVDCDPMNPQAWPIVATGYGYGTVPSCVDSGCLHVHCTGWFCGPYGCYEDLCSCGFCDGPEICATCPPVAVEPTTWGRMKSLYQ